MIGSSVEKIASGQACQFSKEDALDKTDPEPFNARLQVGAAECLFGPFIHAESNVILFQGRAGKTWL